MKEETLFIPYSQTPPKLIVRETNCEECSGENGKKQQFEGEMLTIQTILSLSFLFQNFP